jgi:hypothetical protein
MVDVPNAIAEDFLFHLFCPIAEFLEVVYILLKILLEELLYMDQQVPLGRAILRLCGRPQEGANHLRMRHHKIAAPICHECISI